MPSSEPLSSTFDRLALITQELAAASGNSQIPIKEVAPGQPFDQPPVYELAADRPSAEAEIEQTSRSGLEGYSKLKSGQTPLVGTLLREKLRNLPINLLLKVGLDENLGADSAASAQELQKIAQIRVVPVNQRGSIDFILGRITDNSRQAGKPRGVTIDQPDGSIGLFTLGNTPISRGRSLKSRQLLTFDGKTRSLMTLRTALFKPHAA